MCELRTMSGARSVAFHTLDVFTEERFGGNPLAVVPDASALRSDEMQRIAAEFNLSETAFVLPPVKDGTHRVRIFTPTNEMPFAGHPTIGTALLLAELASSSSTSSQLYEFEEGVGKVTVTVQRGAGWTPFAELKAAQPVEVRPLGISDDEIAAALSLTPRDLAANGSASTAASCGVPFLFVPLGGVEALARARIDSARWESTIRGTWAPHLYPYVFVDGPSGSLIHARMFAPALGIAEDPATGGAATALSAYLAEIEPHVRQRRWTIRQGVEMGRPSKIHARMSRRFSGSPDVFVGGHAILMSRGELWL